MSDLDRDFLRGGGAMAERIGTNDWSTSPLGPIEDWPQSLKTATSLMLASKFAMVIAWGPEFVFLYNDRYIPVLGAKHPASLGRPGAEIFPEVWDSIVGPLFRRATEDEAIALDDVLIPLHRNGFLEECYFTLSYSPIRDETGGVGGLLAVVAETTERVKSERGMRTLRDLAGCCIEADRTEDALREAARVLGENPTDVPWAGCYLLDAASRVAPRVAMTGIVDPALAPPRVALDDAPWPLGTSLAVVRDAVVLELARPGQAQPYGYVVAGKSSQRAFDERYRTFFELAADHIASGLTNARAYEEERRRAEELAAIDRAKTAFFSNISHEFRTPLTLMLGPTEDALRDPERGLRGEQLEAVYRNELRMLKLVNTLLDFARIEAGRIDASYRPLDLSRTTAELASTFRSTIERAGLTFEVRCDALDQPVWVDEAMWEKVVLNLMSNAYKFTFDGGIRVELRCEPDGVCLEIRDTGSGIPEAELPRLFERFHRVHGARSRSHEGSGIGLALVHELVRLHGGRITVESELGRGSVFAVRLPFGTAHLPAERIEATPQLVSTALVPAAFVQEAAQWTRERQPGSSREPGGARVLVVDDNADMRDYVRSLLAEHFDVDTAGDGMEALQMIAARRPEVIVSDVMMPGLDGFGLLRRVRALDGPRIAVILVSARAGEEARIEGIEAGADDYVIKPFSARELVARVRMQVEVAKLRGVAAVERDEARAARCEAEAASHAKDQFLAILGHELRNPLAPIKVALQLIKNRTAEPLSREHEIIERQVDHMTRLVDDLLDVSRITSGKIELRRVVLDAADITLRALEGASDVFSRRRHEVITSIEPGLLVEADETRLSQVLRNLLTNAAKYTPSGGRIEVFARRAGAEIVIGVHDNGIGITADMLPHVFDLFAQEQQSMARSDGGMGLGLAIVRSLIELHGGTVKLESEGRDRGTLVTVRLPATSSPILPISTPLAVGLARDVLRVLVVDDNVDAAVLLAECIQSMGHETAIAFDGAEALRVAETFRPEVALLDIGLPTMNGYELAEQLNTHTTKPLIVAISGYGLEADHLRSRQAGFAAHLVKPVRLDNLHRILAEALAPDKPN